MNANSPRSASSRLNSPRPDVKKKFVTEPAFAYTALSQITNLAWSPVIQGLNLNSGQSSPGEWVAIACGKSVKALKVWYTSPISSGHVYMESMHSSYILSEMVLLLSAKQLILYGLLCSSRNKSWIIIHLTLWKTLGETEARRDSIFSARQRLIIYGIDHGMRASKSYLNNEFGWPGELFFTSTTASTPV